MTLHSIRTCTLTAAERADFDPVACYEKMHAAGFKFDSDVCPLKLTKPWDTVELPDGSVVYRQWEISA